MKSAFIAGARPNFMKIAPLCKALAKHNAACANLKFLARLH